MHSTTGVPTMVWLRCRPSIPSGPGGVDVRVASGDPEPQMPNIAEIEICEPGTVSNGAVRVRKRRDELVPALERLAYNLRWSWDPATRDLFQSLAPEPWA